MNLQNKKIILTGASGGIGAHTARFIANNGGQLVLVGRNDSALVQLRDSLRVTNQPHEVVIADLTSDHERQGIIDVADGVDTLINMAGVNQLSLLTQMTDEQVFNMINCNLIMPMLLTKELIPSLKLRPKAMILNVGSTLGSIGLPGSVAYCASKFGLRGFTEALHRELADTNIKVSYVAPRATRTDMNNDTAISLNNELGNSIDEPERVANIIVNTLCTDKSMRRFIGWPEKLFVTLNALFPKVIDRALGKQLSIIQKHTR